MQRAKLLLAVTLLVWATGCGSEHGTPVQVSGKVTMKGEPLQRAQVMFHAKQGLPAQYRTVVATTDEQGKYVLASVYPAVYTVSFSKVEESANADPEQPLANIEDDRLSPYSPQNSTLEATVTADKTTLDFDLE